MKAQIVDAVLDHITPPQRIKDIANAIFSDLMYGPKYAVAPGGDWSKWTEDYTGDYTQVEELSEHGDPVPVFTSPLAKELRDYLDDLPSELWYDNQSGCILTSAPEAEFDEEFFNEALEAWKADPDHDEEPQKEDYMDEPDWSEITTLDRGIIVEALFGKTIAKEFR